MTEIKKKKRERERNDRDDLFADKTIKTINKNINIVENGNENTGKRVNQDTKQT